MSFIILLSYALLNIVYLAGFFAISILSKVSERHYFLGYNPKLFSFQVRDVKFSIGIYIPIPILSRMYVVINGVKQPMRYPWLFFQHNIARRLIATLGGAFALMVAGWVICIANYYFTEESIITKEEINKYGIYPSDWAIESGFQRGDRILAVNGKNYEGYGDLMDPSLFVSENYYTVRRDGKELQLSIKASPHSPLKNGEWFFSLDVPFEIAKVLPGSAADSAGVKPGDRIIRVDEQPILKFTELTDAFRKDEDGRVLLVVERKSDDGLKTFTADVLLDDNNRIGVWPKELINFTLKKNSLTEAIQKGTYSAFKTVTINSKAFLKLMGGSLSSEQSLSGPVNIADVYRSNFWWITGFYAMWYAFWNLLPLPLSAFWEMIALAYEGVTKKKYPYKAFKTSQILCWILTGLFFIWIFVSDIIRLF